MLVALGRVFCVFVVVLLLSVVVSYERDSNKIQLNLVQAWAERLGAELWHFGEFVTRRKEVQDSFKQAAVEVRDGKKLVENMAADIRAMMELKISAVRRIMDAAENSAVSHQGKSIPAYEYPYYNSKDLDEPDPTKPPFPSDTEPTMPTPPRPPPAVLTPNSHFAKIPVNISFSSVHIPTNVYDRSPEVIEGIQWSDNLDSIFINNYRMDPSLSGQYFGSSTGFMRHYPAMKWRSEPVDIYDCRTRAWYIEAAASPKDVLILVDKSGSMTGQRKDIAKHVVTNILDTLGNNDFVNIMAFGADIDYVVPCFEDILVQANLENMRELKMGLDTNATETTGIANFSAVLIKAFDLLESYRTIHEGARCNQAIMLVTDGVPYNYNEIFRKYNWPDMPVRVFTYLIGKEVADVREVKWMACANRGYYVHLSTLAEVREQVLQHINVLARPFVLQKEKHPVIWTPVYADITDPKMADWLWEIKESEEQKERFMSQRRNKHLFNSKEEQDRRFVLKQKQLKSDQHGDLQKYQLMTSVSMPVYDRRENATRVANLLGVAGTDVPLQDIQALMSPHLLGVNGYAFIVTNNGYILIHPDLRPVFQGILKPSYNSVDMVEVELMDDDGDTRDFHPSLLAFRSEIIEQTTGSKWMQVKYHMEDMKRVSRIRRQYFWTGIHGSPFTLVVTLPEPYGLTGIAPRPTDDIHRAHTRGDNILQYFNDARWRIHPDWLYCRHNERFFDTPEEELLYFLDRMRHPGWKWPLKPRPPEHMQGNISGGRSVKIDNDSYFCDRSLMQALVYDARATVWFNNKSASSSDKGKEFIQRFGITTAFLATHSGLTRWQTFTHPNDEKINLSDEFGSRWPRAIDEIWYKRAVEQHYVEPQSFVYSVPLDGQDTTLVTAAHAVFHSEGGRSAPAATVGFQFKRERLQALFNNITSSCVDGISCSVTCRDERWECWLVDNNGWIITGEGHSHTASEPTTDNSESAPSDEAGRFLGEVRPGLMRQLVAEKVFHPVKIPDYQAVCFQLKENASPASRLNLPWEHLNKIWTWLFTTLTWMWTQLRITSADTYSLPFTGNDAYPEDIYETMDNEMDDEGDGGDGGYASGETNAKIKEREFEKLVVINRTRPQPCDREVMLYHLQVGDRARQPFRQQAGDCPRAFVIQMVPGANLLLIAADKDCENEPVLTAELQEVYHNDSRACRPRLPRKMPSTCISSHPNEKNITLCGKGHSLQSMIGLIISVAIFLQILNYCSIIANIF